MPKDENKKTVRQKDADELHVTNTPSPTAPSTIVEQSDPSKLKATVTQAAKDRTITGNVGILDSLDVRINPAKEDGNLLSIKTNTDNLNITTSAFRDALLGANTKDFSTIQTVIDSIKDTDGIKKITDTVTVTATDLDIRNLAKAQDEIYAVLKTDAGVAYDARDRSWTITETITVLGMSGVKAALEKIDNQEDSITYIHVLMGIFDGDIISSPGAGFFLRIHHIYVNNEGANVTTFEIEDRVSAKWRFCLAASGGAVAQNLKRPWDLLENDALHYDYIGGLFAAINITIGYETISV